jgi:hypothetical protein
MASAFIRHLESLSQEQMKEVFDIHKMQIQCLQWQREGNQQLDDDHWWVLKSPSHVLFRSIESIAEWYSISLTLSFSLSISFNPNFRTFLEN